MPGKLVHFELPSQDVERAKGFWSGLFGWSFNDPGMAGMEYWMTQTADDQGGAIFAAERAGTVVYFDTDEIGASIAKVREARRHRRRRQRDPACRLVHALLRHRGERVQPLPARRVGRRVSGAAAPAVVAAGAGAVRAVPGAGAPGRLGRGGAAGVALPGAAAVAAAAR